MNHVQTKSTSPLQQLPEPLAAAPTTDEAQKAAVPLRDSDAADTAVLGYN